MSGARRGAVAAHEVRRDGEAELRVAVASGDEERVREAVSMWAEQVREAGSEGDGGRLLAEDLDALASHASPKIREAVAGAADAAPEDVFDRWLARFAADEDQYVRAAVARAAKRRATRRKARARQGEHEKVLADLLREIEATYGKGARRLATRAVRRGTEYWMRRLHHEASKIATPLEFSLSRIRAEVDRPDPDVALLARSADVALDRYRHLWSTLDRARAATATITPCFRDEPLLALIEEARAHLVDRLGPRAHPLAFTVDVPRALRLDADRSALLQALQNFLQNAAEAYADDAPRLDIAVTARTLREASQVEITIADRGEGMTENQLDHLFVPFGSGKRGGTGVGLLIARAMIEDVHAGTLKLTSARDAGTTVTLLLPTRQGGRARS
jgi:signal transduction histidine kinase